MIFAFRRDCLAQVVLRGAPYVDNHFIARAETVILGCGDILAGLECERARVKYLMSVNLACRYLSVLAFVYFTAYVNH